MYVKLTATLAVILLAWSPLIAASPLNEVKDLVEDTAMVVSHWDMETFDADVYLTAVAKLYGNPKSLEEPQQLIRESIGDATPEWGAIAGVRHVLARPYFHRALCHCFDRRRSRCPENFSDIGEGRRPVANAGARAHGVQSRE